MNVFDRLQALQVKRIHVFENGNSDSFGRSIIISPKRQRTWNNVLMHIADTLKPVCGVVRHLITVNGKTSIHSFNELKHQTRYVACGREPFLKLRYKTESEHELNKKNKCAKLYPKQVSMREGPDQAQRNKRTVIYVFQNGLKPQAAAKFVLIDTDLQNWNRTLNHIADQIDKSEGIRCLYTTFGRPLCGPCELQHGACYVAVAAQEKFKKMKYLDAYTEFLMNNKETVRAYNIKVIGSPLGIELRNNDCFFSKKNIAGSEKKAVTPMRSKTTSLKKLNEIRKNKTKTNKSSGSDFEEKSWLNEKISKPRKVEGTTDLEKSLKKDSNNKAISSSKKNKEPIAEVTVEEFPVKFVDEDDDAEIISQTTQTSEQPTIMSTSSFAIVTNTPECGIRIVGADEIRAKRSRFNSETNSILATEFANEILIEHSERLQEKIRQSRELLNAESFGRCTVCDVMFQDLEQKIEDEASEESGSSTKAMESLGSEMGTSGLVESTKSLKFFDTDVVIPGEYVDDDVNNEGVHCMRKSISGRRCTGYNFNFSFLSDKADDEEAHAGFLGTNLLRDSNTENSNENISTNISSNDASDSRKLVQVSAKDIADKLDEESASATTTDYTDQDIDDTFSDKGVQTMRPLLQSEAISVMEMYKPHDFKQQTGKEETSEKRFQDDHTQLQNPDQIREELDSTVKLEPIILSNEQPGWITKNMQTMELRSEASDSSVSEIINATLPSSNSNSLKNEPSATMNNN